MHHLYLMTLYASDQAVERMHCGMNSKIRDRL